MSVGRFRAPALAALIVLSNAACATSQSATGAGSDTAGAAATDAPMADNVIRIEVNHNRSDGGTTSVYIEPTAGVRSMLGTIIPGERKVFTYRVEAQNRNIRLSAINASGQTMTSSQITVPRGAGLLWDLQINSLRVRR